MCTSQVNFYQMSLNWDGNHPSEPIPLCGNDSVLPLDGRINIHTAVCKANARARQLNASFGKGIVGYYLVVRGVRLPQFFTV